MNTLRIATPNPSRSIRAPRARRANSLLEFLAVLAGIVILSASAALAYHGRAEQSKAQAADEDIKALIAAETRCAKQYGYYVPLQALDDFPTTALRASELRDEAGNEPESLRAINPDVPADAQIGKQPSFRSKLAGWKGPLLESKRVYLGAGADLQSALSDAATIHRDYPLDPWGNPYRFYSPAGLIGTTAGDAATLGSDAFSDGVLTTNDPRFKVFAIVSFGPDGKSDAVSGGGDDVILKFPEAGGSGDRK